MSTRWILTDKNDGRRTVAIPLPLDASTRLILPGYGDRAFYCGELRSDAPTGSRNAQYLLCTFTSSLSWHLCSADVRSAFLKGDPYVPRELYFRAPRYGPRLPLHPEQLCKVLKGVFGLSDAPREWYLRLDRCLQEHHWQRCFLDQACWVLFLDGELCGMIVGHVDDLLLGGDRRAIQNLRKF